MGTYINPGNTGFARILQRRYVDKTGLIALVNDVVNSAEAFVCVTRPRRFGKSFAAQSLVAYYCYGCDSRSLFEGLEISRDPSFEEHLNAYHVVRLDMTAFTGKVGADVVPELRRVLGAELAVEFDCVKPGSELEEAFLQVVRATGRRFVFVIDEWDAPFRDAQQDEDAQRNYVNFLRLLFKNANFTLEAVAAAYITGILPIKRYGTQSAMTDFREYTMVRPLRYAPYVGFTEEEVVELSNEYALDIIEMRQWYDGYELPRVGHIYAPFSVMEACANGQVGSYWTSSETFEMLRSHIDMDFDGLQGDIVRALGGDELAVDPGKFQNDMRIINGRDDVLTLLIHLGYLAYNPDTRRARIPNEEVRAEFRRALDASRHAEVARIVRESDELLRAIVSGREQEVAEGIARAHDEGCAPLHYSNEQSLRAVVKAALIAAADDYVRIEELPSGRGFADVAYLPKRGSGKPALLVELKWDKPVASAIEQIHDRDYHQMLKNLDVPILLVGITYDAKTKEHTCSIEMLDA